MKTSTAPKSVSVLIALIAAFAMLMLIPQVANAATSTTRGNLKCIANSQNVCTGTDEVGKATTRGTLSNSA
jgi:hypothetical protein